METPTPTLVTRMRDIFIVQAIFFALFAALLDGHVILTCYTIPVIAYWVSVFVLAGRVRFKLGRREVLYINLAWMVIVPAGMAVTLFIHSQGYLK
jgi:hypothetical protein